MCVCRSGYEEEDVEAVGEVQSLLTCLLVKSSPMVQLGPFREHLLRVARALVRSASHSSPLGEAQLVRSWLFVGSFENLTLSQSFHFCGNLIPILNHSQTEEISAHVQSPMSHSNVQ